MNFLLKVHLTLSFADKFPDENRSDYIERVISEAKEKVVSHNADIFEMRGIMFKSEINAFQKILGTKPISSKPSDKPNQYWVTFKVSAEKLLKAN